MEIIFSPAFQKQFLQQSWKQDNFKMIMKSLIWLFKGLITPDSVHFFPLSFLDHTELSTGLLLLQKRASLCLWMSSSVFTAFRLVKAVNGAVRAPANADVSMGNVCVIHLMCVTRALLWIWPDKSNRLVLVEDTVAGPLLIQQLWRQARDNYIIDSHILCIVLDTGLSV